MQLSDEQLEEAYIEMAIHDFEGICAVLIESNSIRPDVILQNRDEIIDMTTKLLRGIGAVQ